MYCRKCGNPVGETDVWCSVCGTRLKEEPSAGVKNTGLQGTSALDAEESKPVRHTELSWNVHDFSTPKRPSEELRMSWTLPQEAEALRAAAASVKTDTAAEKAAGEKVPAEPKAIVGGDPEKEAEAKAAREESVKANEKFFTFTKRNEEFQRLLDQEYEKLRNRTEGEPCMPSAAALSRGAGPEYTAAEQKDETILPQAGQTEKAGSAAMQSAPEQIAPEQSTPEHIIPEDTAPAVPKAAEKEENGASPAEPPVLELLRHRPEEAASVPETAETVQETGRAADAAAVDPVVQQLSELRKTTESFYQQLVEEKEALKHAEKEAARRIETEQRLAQLQARDRQLGADALSRKADGLDTEIKVTVAVKSNGKTTYAETVPEFKTVPEWEPEPIPASAERTEPEPAAAPVGRTEAEPVTAPAGKTEPEAPVSQDTIRIVKTEEQQADAAEQKDQTECAAQTGQTETADRAGASHASPVAEEGWHENTLNSFFAVDPPEQGDESRADKPKRSGIVGKVILTVIALILAVEIIALGIRYFAPESGAAAVVESAEMQIARGIDQIVDYIKGFR